MKTLTQTLTTAAVALVLALGAAAATSTISYADDTQQTPPASQSSENKTAGESGGENADNADADANTDKDTTPSTTTQQTLTRLYGTEAYDTAAKIALEAYKTTDESGNITYEQCDNVVIANSSQFADAMSAAGLAGALNAPILLTPKDSLENSVKDAINTLKPLNVYIIGGTGVISKACEDELAALETVTNVERVSGEAACNTSAACAEKLAELKDSEKSDYAIIANSATFQDAVSISSFAYAHKVPILLTTTESDVSERRLGADELATFISDLNADAKVLVLGGTAAVSQEVQDDINLMFRSEADAPKVKRLYGTTAYDTSLEIAKYLTEKDANGNSLMSTTTATVASGNTASFGLDALAGAALAGKKQSVILLGGTSDKDGTTAVSSFISANDKDIKDKYILGGTKSLSDDITKTFDSDHKHTYNHSITIDTAEYNLVDIVEDTPAHDDVVLERETLSRYDCTIHGDTRVKTEKEAAETGLAIGHCKVTLDYEENKDKAVNGGFQPKDGNSPDGGLYNLYWNATLQKSQYICVSNTKTVQYQSEEKVDLGKREHHDAITHEVKNKTYPTAITLKAINACSCGHEQDEDTTSTCNHNWQTKETGYYTYSRDVTLEDCIDHICTTIEGKQGPVTDPKTGDVYLGIIKEEVENGTHYDYNKYNAAVTAHAVPAKQCTKCGMWSVD